jgi:hypothetical protein
LGHRTRDRFARTAFFFGLGALLAAGAAFADLAATGLLGGATSAAKCPRAFLNECRTTPPRPPPGGNKKAGGKTRPAGCHMCEKRISYTSRR